MFFVLLQLHKKQNLITRIVHYDGTLFTGSITNVVVGLPLQFYFLGNVTTAATNVPTCLVGFNNKVTVIFAENTFTSSKEAINLPAGNGEKWAIRRPSFFEGRLLLFYPSKGAGGWAGHYPKNQYTF